MLAFCDWVCLFMYTSQMAIDLAVWIDDVGLNDRSKSISLSLDSCLPASPDLQAVLFVGYWNACHMFMVDLSVCHVHGLSVCVYVCVGHNSEPCKNG